MSATTFTPPTAMTGCLAPIDKAGLNELIAKGRANPQAIKTLKCTTIAEGRFRHLNMIRDLPPYIVDEWIGTSSSPYGPDFCPRKGRIPGARWIEWYRLMKPSAAGPVFNSAPEILAECASVGVTPSTPVYLYCFKGARASNSLVALKEAGITDVRLYFGSWNEWSRDESLPIESGLPYAVAAE